MKAIVRLSVLIIIVRLGQGSPCHFPGIPARGLARWNNHSLTWNERYSQFQVNDKIVYDCPGNSAIPPSQQTQIVCRPNGTWDASVPRCEQELYFWKWNHRPKQGFSLTYANESDGQVTYRSWIPKAKSRKFFIEAKSQRRDNHLISELVVESHNPSTEITVSYGDRTAQMVTFCDRIVSNSFQCQVTPVQGHKVYIDLEPADKLERVIIYVNNRRNCRKSQPPVPPGVEISLEESPDMFQCRDQLVPQGSYACNETTGAWTAPECRCGPPPHSNYSNVTRINDTCSSFVCHSNLELAGEGLLTCNSSGTWSEPECRHKATQVVDIGYYFLIIPILLLVVILIVVAAFCKRRGAMFQTETDTKAVVDEVDPRPTSDEGQVTSEGIYEDLGLDGRTFEHLYAEIELHHTSGSVPGGFQAQGTSMEPVKSGAVEDIYAVVNKKNRQSKFPSLENSNGDHC